MRNLYSIDEEKAETKIGRVLYLSTRKQCLRFIEDNNVEEPRCRCCLESDPNRLVLRTSLPRMFALFVPREYHDTMRHDIICKQCLHDWHQYIKDDCHELLHKWGVSPDKVSHPFTTESIRHPLGKAQGLASVLVKEGDRIPKGRREHMKRQIWGIINKFKVDVSDIEAVANIKVPAPKQILHSNPVFVVHGLKVADQLEKLDLDEECKKWDSIFEEFVSEFEDDVEETEEVVEERELVAAT